MPRTIPTTLRVARADGYKADMCQYLVPQPAPANLLSVFADWTNSHYGTGFGASCYYSTECLRNPAYASQWPNQRAWVWQCCSEVAYWQVHYEGALRSSVMTLDAFNSQCATAFGVPGMVPAVDSFNARYRGWQSNATRVFAYNGECMFKCVASHSCHRPQREATLTPVPRVPHSRNRPFAGKDDPWQGATVSER